MQGMLPQQPAHIFRLTTAIRCHQQLKPFLGRVITQLYPKFHQEIHHAENHEDRLEKCKQILFRSLENPPFSPKSGIHPYHTKGLLVFRPTKWMDNLHQENIPPAGTPTTSTEL